MNPIKFSIIIPTYNRAHLITKTLNSVLEQDYPHFEILVVDDGSTDATQEVVENIQSPKIQYHKIPNGERAKARNFGIQKATGDFITFLDSDDILYAHHFSTAQNLIVSHPNDVFFSLAYEVIDTSGKVLHSYNQRKGDLNRQLITGNHLSCMGVFVKRDILLVNLFNEQRSLSGTEDYELWLRLASQYRIIYNNVITSAIINHESRSVLSFEEKKLVDRMVILENALRSSSSVMTFYKDSGVQTIMAHSWLYVSLHLAMSKKKKPALQYLLKAGFMKWHLFFTRKTLAIIKKLLIG
jgi:glycosyltransferase involved in cell wall biosynthesis